MFLNIADRVRVVRGKYAGCKGSILYIRRPGQRMVVVITDRDTIAVGINQVVGDEEGYDRDYLISEVAYSLYESRGYATGHDKEDWAAAEALVDSRLPENTAPQSRSPRREAR